MKELSSIPLKKAIMPNFFRKFWKIFITTLLASSSEDKVKMR